MIEDNDVIEISFEQIFSAIYKAFVPCAMIAILCTTLGFLVTRLILEDEFSATAKLIIVQERDDSTQISYSDIQTSQNLVDTYSEILKSEAISDDVIRNLELEELEIDTEAYNEMVSVTSTSGTEVISITVESNNPKLSADMANEIVAVFNSKIYDIMQIKNVTALNQAKVPLEASGPSTLMNMAIGLMLGLVIDGCIIMLLIFNDRKVKTEEEVKKIFDAPIIGIIPDVEGLGE